MEGVPESDVDGSRALICVGKPLGLVDSGAKGQPVSGIPDSRLA
jgi:hypothetical protein